MNFGRFRRTFDVDGETGNATNFVIGWLLVGESANMVASQWRSNRAKDRGMRLLPRFSIRAMIFAVFVVAADLAALGLIGPYAQTGLRFGLFSILPMSNILAVVSYRAATCRTPGRPFLIGFALAGAFAVLIWFHLFLMADERQLVNILSFYMNKSINYVQTFGTLTRSSCAILCQIALLVLLVCLSVLLQMLVALSGGWIARRYATGSRPIVSTLLPPSR